MSSDSSKPRNGEYVLVVAHYCEMSKRVGKVISISEDAGDSMPYMVRFLHNRREWPFAAEELEALGPEKPMMDDNGRLRTRRKP